MSRTELTPGLRRALAAGGRWGSDWTGAMLSLPQVLLGLLAEHDSFSAQRLAELGITESAVSQRWQLTPATGNDLGEPSNRNGETPGWDAEVTDAMRRAESAISHYPRPHSLASEHLLLGIVTGESLVAELLAHHGLDAKSFATEVHARWGFDASPIPIDWPDQPPRESTPTDPASSLADDAAGPPLAASAWEASATHAQASPVAMHDPSTPTTSVQGLAPEARGVLRLIDAAANRAAEGLRAVEDYVRFVLDDAQLTAECKRLRHALRAALAALPQAELISARRTPSDVGVAITLPSEQSRASAQDTAIANCKRTQQAVRSLEEYCKLSSASVAAAMEQIRYATYVIEQRLQVGANVRSRLARARLYALITVQADAKTLANQVEAVLTAGVDVIQLRDKQASDRLLVERGKLLRRVTQQAEALLIINDRADLAVATDADGVHVGQDELTVAECRRILGASKLVGVSTHSMEQARAAVGDGADYLGVGPTFASATKSFDTFAGLDFVRQVSTEIGIPWFAIGGIASGNLGEVIKHGATRVAVSQAIWGSDDPAGATLELAERLRSK